METIAAISTPNAPGGIAMIRISGDRALDVAAAVFQPVGAQKVKEMRGYSCAYGYVYDGDERLDDVILTVFRAPHSYTGEDTAEITCHGGIYLSKRILRLIFAAGAAAAGPGEFTKRAFLNGKMSLTQAEAVMDVIAAEGEAALRQAETAREGRLGREMQRASEELVSLLAALAYWMDDAEEFPPELEHSALIAKITQIRDNLTSLSANYDNGRMVREGIRTVFLGLPNAGKSSLMNLLCGSRRSIVTDIPGTTRDIVREYVKINEFTLILSDTAGIRESADEIEAIGVADAMHEAEQADLIFYVIDSTNSASEYDRELLNQLNGRRVLVLWNKTDRTETPPPDLPFPVLPTNALDVSTTDTIYHALHEMFADACFSNQPCVMNERQNQLVLQAISALSSVLTALKQNAPLDMLFFDLESAANLLEQIEGTNVSDSVLDEVFSKFCVGK